MKEENEVNKIVEEISKINFQGNIIPSAWYQYIKFPSGKADLLGITILSDIIYWYRKIEIRDEKTGQLLHYKKKFKADKLQRSYNSYAKQFGVSKRQVKDAIKRLEKLGLITIEFRNITTNDGLSINNLLFLEPIPSEILDITHQRNTYDVQTSYDPHSNVTPIAFERKTNTEITTDITTKTTTMEEAPHLKSEAYTPLYKEIIEYLNTKAKKGYRTTTKSTQRLIRARLNEGFTVDDFKKVIDITTEKWKNKKTNDGVDMEDYLRPETLFGKKFESYLNQKVKSYGKLSPEDL